MDRQILVALAAGWVEDKLHELVRSHGKFFKALGGDAKEARLHLLRAIKEAVELLIEMTEKE